MADTRFNGPPDLRGESGRELHYTVSPRFSSVVHLRVDPSSICAVGFEDGADQRLTMIADPQGRVRFHVNALDSPTDFARLSLESESNGTVSHHAIDLRFGDEPTSDMPAPPRPGPSDWSDETRVRRPLSISELLSTPDEELVQRRYPMRPNPEEAPRAFELWRRLVSAPAIEVEPVLIERPGVTHGLAEAGPATSLNWSGFELREMAFMQQTLGGRLARYDWVSGSWHVPSVVGRSVGNDYSTMWIGLDGDGVPDLYQAGTEQDVATGKIGSITASLSSYYAWTEFLPQEKFEQTISGFAVEPGDEIFACVWIGDPGSGPKLAGDSGFTYIHNFRSGEFTITQTARGSTQVGGTEAEWIMERTQITPPGGTAFYPNLADYGTAIISGAYARLTDSPFGKGYVSYQGGPNRQLTMRNAVGDTLSTVRPVDAESMEFHWGDPRTSPVFPARPIPSTIGPA